MGPLYFRNVCKVLVLSEPVAVRQLLLSSGLLFEPCPYVPVIRLFYLNLNKIIGRNYRFLLYLFGYTQYTWFSLVLPLH